MHPQPKGARGRPALAGVMFMAYNHFLSFAFSLPAATVATPTKRVACGSLTFRYGGRWKKTFSVPAKWYLGAKVFTRPATSAREEVKGAGGGGRRSRAGKRRRGGGCSSKAGGAAGGPSGSCWERRKEDEVGNNVNSKQRWRQCLRKARCGQSVAVPEAQGGL